MGAQRKERVLTLKGHSILYAFWGLYGIHGSLESTLKSTLE